MTVTLLATITRVNWPFSFWVTLCKVVEKLESEPALRLMLNLRVIFDCVDPRL